MGRVYTAVFEGVSVSVAQDLFHLAPAANKAVVIHEVHITQDSGETSEQLPVRCRRMPATVTAGTGGTVLTPTPANTNDSASGATVRANDMTTRTTSSGTARTLRRMGDNVLNGWHWIFTPETRPHIINGDAFVVGLETAPAAALLVSGELVYEELG